MEKFVEKILGKSPGLDLVILVITGFTIRLMMDKQSIEEWDPVIVPAVWIVSLLLFRFSGTLDDWVFDTLFGTHWKKQPRRRRFLPRAFFPVTILADSMRRNLDKKRNDAVKVLELSGALKSRGVSGIYASAQTIFQGTEHWEKRIKSLLEFSKAARVFVYPLILILIWEALHDWFGAPLPYIPVKAQQGLIGGLVSASQSKIAVYALLQAVAGLYVYLRIIHVRRLYDLLIESIVFTFQVGDPNQPRQMFCIGNVVVPQSELSIFKTRILCIGCNDEDLKAIKEEKIPGVEIAKAKSLRKLKKMMNKDQFDVFVVKKRLFADVGKLQKSLVYPQLNGKVLILTDEDLKQPGALGAIGSFVPSWRV